LEQLQNLNYLLFSIIFFFEALTFCVCINFPCLNLLGFTHSAFALGYEASINKCPIDGNLVPPGALITFVQKGLQYLEMEANLSNVSIPNSFAFPLLSNMTL
jgi:hypothetical protein